MSLKFTNLKLQSHSPGANEVIYAFNPFNHRIKFTWGTFAPKCYGLAGAVFMGGT